MAIACLGVLVTPALGTPRAVAAVAPAWFLQSAGAPDAIGGVMAYDAATKPGSFVYLDAAGITWTGDGATWTSLGTTTGPSPRQFATMAFDGSQVVLFGGQDPGGQALDDTWTWNGSSWTQQDPNKIHPLGRSDAGMASEPGGGVVLFGGDVPAGQTCPPAGTPGVPGVNGIGSVPCGFDPTTWVWDGQGWTQYTGAAPRPRKGAAMAADPVSGRVLLFGGLDLIQGGSGAGIAGTSATLDDTWTWDGTGHQWLEQAPVTATAASAMPPGATAPSGPPARLWAGMAPDPGGVMLFGGRTAIEQSEFLGAQNNDQPLNDTWRWDGRGWTQLATDPAHTPTARWRPALASAGGGTVLYGGVMCRPGVTGCGSASTVPPRDTSWTWNGATWAPLGGQPASRDLAAATFDPVSQRTLVFGGRGQPPSPGNRAPSLGDPWIWDGTAWGAGAGPVPPARDGAGLVYDPATRRAVLFGGEKDGSVLNDTWIWDGSTMRWTQPPTSGGPPPARVAGSLAVDPLGHVVLFGGWDGNNPLSDTWTWDGSSWTQKSPNHVPSARSGAAMTYDPVRQRVVLFGGVDGASPLGDTWTWDGSDWSPLSPAPAPPARSGAAMAFDDALGMTVLVGGATCPASNPSCTYASEVNANGSVALGDAWTWNGSAWAPLTTANPPPARSDAALTYDSVHRQLVLLGGNRNPGGTVARGGVIIPEPGDFLNDTWTIDPTITPPGVGVTLTPAGLGLGAEPVGTTSAPRMVTVTNTGSSPLVVSGVATSSSDYQAAGDCPASLPSESSCTVMVTFRPTAAGVRTGALTVADDAPGSPQTVSLSGTGLSAPSGVAAPLYLEGVTLLGGTSSPIHVPDGAEGSCQAGPASMAGAPGTGLPGCGTSLTNNGGAAVLNASVAAETLTPGAGGRAATARSSLTTLGLQVGGVTVLSADLLDATATVSCSAGPSATSSIGSVTVADHAVATQPVGSRIVFSPTGKGSVTLYGNPISVNPTGARIPMAVVTLNYSRHDASTGTQASSPLEIDFPARGPLSALIVGRIFVSYAAASVSHC